MEKQREENNKLMASLKEAELEIAQLEMTENNNNKNLMAALKTKFENQLHSDCL